MSAIFGYTGSLSCSDSMVKVLRHWQADREQIICKNNICLGALELYNTPESLLTPQPYQYKNWLIAADCRIDNRNELADKLSIAGIDVISDIQLIALAYEKWGQECVNHLIGDFVFVIADTTTQKIVIVRDHLGIRPIYYSIIANELVFSSEIKGILAYPGFIKKYNEKVIVSEFSALQPTADETLYEGIYLLPAASYLIWHNKQLTLKCYWQLNNTNVKIPDSIEEQEQEFNRLMYQSVSCRLRSFRALGAEVSGGLDSTGIAAIAMNLLGKGHPFNSFSYKKHVEPIICEEVNDDEAIVIDFCKHHEIEHYLTLINDKDISLDEYLEKMCEVYDEVESNGVPSFSPSFLKYAQKKEVGTILSGWGGDAVVTNTSSSYSKSLASQKKYIALWKDIRSRRPTARSSIRGFLSKAIKYNSVKKLRNAYLKKQNEQLKNLFVRPEIVSKYTLDKLPGLMYYFETAPDIKSYQFRKLLSKGVEKRVINHVIMGQHYKVDYRFPMLDVRLLTYLYHLPFSTIAPRGQKRYLFKKLVAPIVPEQIIKTGKSRILTIPFAYAFQIKNFNEIKKRFLNNNNPILSKYIDYEAAAQVTKFEREKRMNIINYYFLSEKLK